MKFFFSFTNFCDPVAKTHFTFIFLLQDDLTTF